MARQNKLEILAQAGEPKRAQRSHAEGPGPPSAAAPLNDGSQPLNRRGLLALAGFPSLVTGRAARYG
jgi:hypothetical protein